LILKHEKGKKFTQKCGGIWGGEDVEISSGEKRKGYTGKKDSKIIKTFLGGRERGRRSSQKTHKGKGRFRLKHAIARVREGGEGVK